MRARTKSEIVIAMPILIILIIALKSAITILIIRLICQYMAKQNARAFDYDYLAERTAEELYKRYLNEKGNSAYKDATGSAEDQSRGSRTGAAEQDENRQE